VSDLLEPYALKGACTDLRGGREWRHPRSTRRVTATSPPYPTTQLLPPYHWHMEVIPRPTRVADFEWGSGFCINPVPPEQAAQFLHETEVDVTASPWKK
jgi:hypothetical protein